MKTESDHHTSDINKEFTHFTENHEEEELRRGPWTLEEDTLLTHHVACHGEGRWNFLAKSAGLRRTGKSCRLRWLNYLKPDIKRGNLSPQEQLLILELHSKWGNRWSKIAAQLPGRTDNEIKNYWRTRVQKQAKQLNMECNSQSFIDAIKCYYMPILVQKIEQNSANSTVSSSSKASPNKLGEFNDTLSSNTSLLPSNVPKIPEEKPTVDGYCSLHNCDYDHMDLAYTSALGLTDCHVVDDNWWGDDVADDSMWDLDELWQFRK